MRILILGGDGYLGWPTAMSFSSKGHEVQIVDNYLRRTLCKTHGVEPLYPVPDLPARAALWNKVSGRHITAHIGDCADYSFLSPIFASFKPEAVVHYAEQPSAPYSMIDHSTAFLTLTNNLQATLNLIHAVHTHCPSCHIIKLGTMGEYGTPDIDIEEGWIDITHKGRSDRFLFPRQAGSLYHTTKIQDTDLLWFYVRTWNLRVTDLMQGPVYGLSTPETDLHPSLGTIFNYDEIFGTVLNRFIVQAITNHPLTVYGKGGQTRGYLNILDTLSCIELAAATPTPPGELRVLNQLTETFTVNELAEKVTRIGRSRGHDVQIKSIPNPRVEKEEHYYNPTYTGLLDLGLSPHLLTDERLSSIFALVEKHRDSIQPHIIFKGIKW